MQTFEGGDIEYKFLGPHQDQRKTKELQDQGKKINLSLSEARSERVLVYQDKTPGTPRPKFPVWVSELCKAVSVLGKTKTSAMEVEDKSMVNEMD